ncbi:MAG: ACT domain-containing protein [Planctomycetota bacterium]|nr:ACT domain-containing protein [Planctomycetota bacterium]
MPDWATGKFVTISRTCDELSIVCAQSAVPSHVRHERDKIALGIEGVIPMTTIGLLAQLCAALAAASVPVFVISTYDTDWLLVSAERFTAAKSALEEQGHQVRGALPLN